VANPTLFSNNADIKYPLSDFHEEVIPNDILLDLSLNVPDGIEPVLTILRIGLGFAFVAFEDSSTRVPVASVLVQNPLPARVVPLDMSVEGFGWVVFGPGLSSSFYSGDVAVELDPETVVSMVQTAPTFALIVNGIRTPIENVLRLEAANGFLTIRALDQHTVVIDRNDAEILDEQLQGFTDLGTADEGDVNILQTLDNVRPDSQGNIDIDIVNCVEGCKDVYSLEIPRGIVEAGISEELPLDTFQPDQVISTLDPCFSSSSSISSSLTVFDPFEGCQDIIKTNIIDSTGFVAVGTLYTVSTEFSSSISSGECDNIVWEDLNNMIWEDTNNAIWECSPEPPPSETLLLEDDDDAILEDGEPWLLE
jgi:hypothetical protein